MPPKDKEKEKKKEPTDVFDSVDGISYAADSWVPNDGLQMAGTETVGLDSGMSYSFGDLGQLELFPEEDMREKYPALKQAYEHYQSVLEVCKTKEKEDNDS
jgi:hypothetical protein